MRVAIVLFEDFPGSDNRVQRECRSLLRAGHEVTVFCATGPSTVGEFEGAQIVRSRVRRYKSASLIRRLYDYIAFPLSARRWLTQHAEKFDVVQVANPPDWLALAARRWRDATGGRLVLDIHDPMPELYETKASGALAVALLRWLERASCRAADGVIVTTEPMVRRVRASDGVDAVLVRNTVDRSRFPLRTPGVDMGISGTQRVVYHGTVQHRFGVDLAVEAIALLAAEGMDVSLDVYGDGNALSSIARRVSALSPGLVTLHGQVPSADLAGRLMGASVGLVPYRDSPFMRLVESTKALEYASLGIPVVGSDLAPLRAQLGDEGAVYTRPGDVDELAAGIRAVIGDADRALSVARNAQRFTADDVWENCDAAYVAAVVGESGGGA